MPFTVMIYASGESLSPSTRTISEVIIGPSIQLVRVDPTVSTNHRAEDLSCHRHSHWNVHSLPPGVPHTKCN